MIEEQFLTLAEAAVVIPRHGNRKVHVSTLWRWARKGIQGVRLRTWRFGNRIFTTEPALLDFAVELAKLPPNRKASRRSGHPSPFLRKRTDKQRQRDIEQAMNELKKAGI